MKVTVENAECAQALPLGMVMLKKQTEKRLSLGLPWNVATYQQGDFAVQVRSSEFGDTIDIKGGETPDLFVCGVASNADPLQDFWLIEGRSKAGRVMWRKLAGPGNGLNRRAYGIAADKNKVYVAGLFDSETAGVGKFYVEARSIKGGGKVWYAYSGPVPAVGYAYCVTEHNGFLYVGGMAQMGDVELAGAWSYLIQKRNASTGALVWEKHAINIAAHVNGHSPSIAAISVLGEFVYAVGRVRQDTGYSSMSKAATMCLNAADGTIAWEQTLTAHPAESEYRAVAAYDGALYIAGSVEQAITPLAWYVEKRTLAGELVWGNFSVELAEGGATSLTLAKDVTDPLKRRLFIVGALNVGAPLHRSYWRTEERDMANGALLTDYARLTNVSDYATAIATDDLLGTFVVGQINTLAGGDKLSVGQMNDDQTYRWTKEPTTTFSETTQATGVALRPRS